MAFIRERFEQLKTAWGQMTGTGRLSLALIGLLVLAMIVMITQEVGKRDMQPLPTSFAGPEINRAVTVLTSSGIECDVRGNQIFVPTGRVDASVGALASNEALSAEHTVDFDQLLGASSIWHSETDREMRRQLFITRKLESWISQMRGVKRAGVSINFGSSHTLRSQPTGVSASVNVETPRNQPLDKSTALAIADLLAGSVNGLDRREVKIVDSTNAISFNLAEDGLTASGDYIPLLRQYEAHYNTNLREFFAYIPGLFIKARVVPNIHGETVRQRSVDPTNVIAGAITDSSSVKAGGSASGEPGVVTNVGTDPGAGQAAAHSDTESLEQISPAIDYGYTESLMHKLPGEIKEIGAAINIPQSYFVGIARQQAGGGEDVEIDESKLAAITEAEKGRIQKLALGILGFDDPNQVVVDSYPDFIAEAAAAAAPAVMEAGSSTDFLALLQQAAPSVGLALLAVGGLWVLWSLVKRIQPVSVPAEVSPAGDGVGEAGLTLDSILEGVELEADTIRTSKMQDQISSMIKEDPDAMANLVKRWISQE